MNWAARYVGIRFADGGCSLGGCSCWGLVRMVLRNECGIELPAYAEISAEDLAATARQMSADSAAPPWSKVTEPQPFDVVLMYAMHGSAKFPGHVGIMASSTDVLHVWRATDTVYMPIDHPRMRYRIIGFHRHERLRDG